MLARFLLLALGLWASGCSRQGQAGPSPAPSGDEAKGGGESAIIPGQSPNEELAKFAGTWTGSVLHGDAPGGKVTVVFKGDTMAVTFLRTGRTIENKFTLDPAKSPKGFDILPSNKSSQGIYEFEGDVLKICLGNHDVRPSRFGGKMGMVTAIYRLTRQ